MKTERRQFPRDKLDGEATVFFANESLPCRLVNVSDTGMAVIVSSKQIPPSSVRIQFMPPRQSLPVAVDAIIIRRRPCGSKVEWGVKLLSPLPKGAREVVSKSLTAYRINHAKDWLRELERLLAATERERDALSEQLDAQLRSSGESKAQLESKETSAEPARATISTPIGGQKETYPEKWWLVPRSDQEAQ